MSQKRKFFNLFPLFLFLSALTTNFLALDGHADDYQSTLNQQQSMTAEINSNRTKVSDLQSQLQTLENKISKLKENNENAARAVQVNDPSTGILELLLSSQSLTQVIQRLENISLLVAATNQQVTTLKNDESAKQKMLSALTSTQLELDQQNQALSSSIDAYNVAVAADEVAPVTFTPKNTGPASLTPSQSSSKSTSDNQNSDTSASSYQPLPLEISEADARANIVMRESGGNYQARNGQYYGAYQLDISYLGGDLSPAHQDAVAQDYVIQRYGSWANAWTFWQANHWY